MHYEIIGEPSIDDASGGADRAMRLSQLQGSDVDYYSPPATMEEEVLGGGTIVQFNTKKTGNITPIPLYRNTREGTD